MLKYQFPSERSWREKANLFQLPKNAYFSFGQKSSSNGKPSRNLYDRLSPPKRWSLNPLNPSRVEVNLMATFGHQIHGIYTMNGKQPSGEIPSYVSKFVNHLMIGGKKGVAIHLFVAALHLFLKRLEEEKRVDGLGKRSFPIKTTAFYPLLHTTSVANARSEGSPSMAGGSLAAPGHRGGGQRTPSKSLILPVNSWGPSSFLQRPGKNLLGLSFSSPSTDGRISFFASSKKKLQPFNPNVCNTEVSSYKHSSLLSCLEFAVKNVEPSLEVRKKKIAGITRQIPCIVAKPRGQGLAIRWIISAAQEKRRREGKAFHKSLAEELVNAYHKRGEPRQKRDSLHRVAESNRSFLRYRWW